MKNFSEINSFQNFDNLREVRNNMSILTDFLNHPTCIQGRRRCLKKLIHYDDHNKEKWQGEDMPASIIWKIAVYCNGPREFEKFCHWFRISAAKIFKKFPCKNKKKSCSKLFLDLLAKNAQIATKEN